MIFNIKYFQCRHNFLYSLLQLTRCRPCSRQNRLYCRACLLQSIACNIRMLAIACCIVVKNHVVNLFAIGFGFLFTVGCNGGVGAKHLPYITPIHLRHDQKLHVTYNQCVILACIVKINYSLNAAICVLYSSTLNTL